MLIDKTGTINPTVKSAIIKNLTVNLSSNQFFKISSTGRSVELWEGKKEYLSNAKIYSGPQCPLRKVYSWTYLSVKQFIS